MVCVAVVRTSVTVGDPAKRQRKSSQQIVEIAPSAHVVQYDPEGTRSHARRRIILSRLVAGRMNQQRYARFDPPTLLHNVTEHRGRAAYPFEGWGLAVQPVNARNLVSFRGK